jgi:hypothetical protein
MAETYKELYDGLLSAKPATLYTPGSGVTAKAKGFELLELSAADNAVVVYIGKPPVATSSRARSSNVATLVTGSDHGLTTGDYIDIVGLGGTGYNASRVQVTVTNTTTFTYSNTGSDEGTTSDTAGVVILTKHRYWPVTAKAGDNLEKAPLAPKHFKNSDGHVLSGYAANANAVRLIVTGSEEV